MYDKAFDSVELMDRIRHIFNRSTSVEFIVSTKDLIKDFNFMVTEYAKIGPLFARGGNMSSIFYIYKVSTFF